jgi:signal transduction histidine kinase
VQRLDRLVANLLDSIRPMTPRMKLTDLGGLIDEALAQSLRAQEGAQHIQVHRLIDPAVPAVPVDVALLGMALTNVFRNALQAMASGGELHVAIAREEQADRGWARLSVRDTGPGIPSEVQGRLFEPFFTSRPTGNGLGLTIVRRVVDEHRGTVDISSEPGHGTTCLIRLPLSESMG